MPSFYNNFVQAEMCVIMCVAVHPPNIIFCTRAFLPSDAIQQVPWGRVPKIYRTPQRFSLTMSLVSMLHLPR
jgi:hypothetical protein